MAQRRSQDPSLEITIGSEEIARVEAALDIFLPPIASVSEVITEPLIEREVEQLTTAENVSLQHHGGSILVTERSGYGHHRLIGRIDGARAGQAVTLSALAKPAGCSKLKIELHDDGAEQYVTSTFDLKSENKLSRMVRLSNPALGPQKTVIFIRRSALCRRPVHRSISLSHF